VTRECSRCWRYGDPRVNEEMLTRWSPIVGIVDPNVTGHGGSVEKEEACGAHVTNGCFEYVSYEPIGPSQKEGGSKYTGLHQQLAKKVFVQDISDKSD
jgi:hypothetical protein